MIYWHLPEECHENHSQDSWKHSWDLYVAIHPCPAVTSVMTPDLLHKTCQSLYADVISVVSLQPKNSDGRYAVITKQTEMFVLYIAQYTYCPNKGRGHSVKFCTILASFFYLTSFLKAIMMWCLQAYGGRGAVSGTYKSKTVSPRRGFEPRSPAWQAGGHSRCAFWMAVCLENVHLVIASVVLNLGSSGPMDVFQGVRGLGWGKKLRLFYFL